CLGSDVLVFPLAASIDLATATLGEVVVVGPLVAFALLDESFLNQFVEVRIESAVVDLAFVVAVKFILDCEPFRLVLSCNRVQYVALEPSQIVHILLLVILTGKYIDSRNDYSAGMGHISIDFTRHGFPRFVLR